MTREEAVEWLNDIIQRSADCDKMSIDDERLEAITVAIEALKQSQASADTWFDPEDETLVMQRILQREEDMRNIADDNFEPWLPNSRNQRCVLPLINLLLKDWDDRK